MNLTLTRKELKEDCTIGELSIDGVFFCYTVEDKDRGLTSEISKEEIEKKKIYGITAIPKGTYNMVVNMSNRFKKEMPLLLNVKGFEGIRIHAGNTAVDSLGCILVGLTKTSVGVGYSRLAFIKLMEILKKESTHTIKIQ